MVLQRVAGDGEGASRRDLGKPSMWFEVWMHVRVFALGCGLRVRKKRGLEGIMGYLGGPLVV